MNKLEVDFIVREVGRVNNKIAWQVKNSEYLSKKYDSLIKGYNIYFANSVNDSFVKVNESLIDDCFYVHILYNYTKFNSMYYRIEAELFNGVKVQSDNLDIFPSKSLTYYTMMRNDVFDLMKQTPSHEPIPVLFYSLKTSGEKCTRCNYEQGSCLYCLGTGINGGYYNPVLAYIKYTQPFQKLVEQNTYIKTESSSQFIHTSAYFISPKPGDHFKEIHSPNRLFMISSAAADSEWGGKPLSYNCPAILQDSYHPIYNIELPLLDLKQKVYYDTCMKDYHDNNTIIREKCPEIRSKLL